MWGVCVWGGVCGCGCVGCVCVGGGGGVGVGVWVCVGVGGGGVCVMKHAANKNVVVSALCFSPTKKQ